MPESPVQLAPPGQGPGWLARQVMRYWVKPLRIRPTLWEDNLLQLERAQTRLANDIRDMRSDPQLATRLGTQVLVSPRQGLEDSSRFWSVAMTCQHLTIVGHGMLRVIEALSHDQDPKIIVDTAKVKPSKERDSKSAIDDYLAFTADSLKWLDSALGPKRTGRSWSHPWFGPLQVKDWLWLMGFHTKIHHSQIRDITSGLRLTDQNTMSPSRESELQS